MEMLQYTNNVLRQVVKKKREDILRPNIFISPGKKSNTIFLSLIRKAN